MSSPSVGVLYFCFQNRKFLCLSKAINAALTTGFNWCCQLEDTVFAVSGEILVLTEDFCSTDEFCEDRRHVEVIMKSQIVEKKQKNRNYELFYTKHHSDNLNITQVGFP